MTYTIAWEPLSVLVASGLEDLAVAHWEEVEIDKEHVPLALDLERARAFEKVGQHATAALRREGVLVGYAAFTLMTAMFHRHTLHAFCSAVYVDPASRGPASLWLIDWCEKALADKGVVKIYIGSKTGTLSALLDRRGYACAERVHTKILGGSHERRQSSAYPVPAAQPSRGRERVPGGGGSPGLSG